MRGALVVEKPAVFQHCQQALTVNKGYGRIEERLLLTSTQLNDYLNWPAVAHVLDVETRIQHSNGKQTRKVVYGLTSLFPEKASLARLLKLIRQYLGIEGGLHYRRDVTMCEDPARLSVGSAGQVKAILNNLVIHLASTHGKGNLAITQRCFDAKPA